MSLNKRRILYILFIITFLVLTPLISLYATGYRLGTNLAIKKTAILIMDSEPKGASIYLDGKLQENFFRKYFTRADSRITTPVKIKNLLPGDYEVKVELEGYWPWEKKLELKPGESTFAEDIYLFKNDLPIIQIPGSFQKLCAAWDKKYILAAGEQTISYINLNKEKGREFNIPEGNSLNSNSECLWSEVGDRLIINDYYLDIEDSELPASLPETITKNITKIRWSENGKILNYATVDGIYGYSLSTAKSKPILLEKSIDDFLVSNNYIYYITQFNGSTNLKIFHKENNELLKHINLPRSNYAFINPESKLLNLYDLRHEILYLIDPLSGYKPLRETISNVNKTVWINDSNLLYANDFEIWIFNLDSWHKTLLTRISKPIGSIIWHPNNGYLIYATNKEIYSLELDRREKYNITKLIELDVIIDPVLNKKGNALYFISKIGNQEGVYKLVIQ